MRGATTSLPGPIAPDQASEALRAGSKLGNYELLACIATGGTAQVWVARHAGALGFRRLVAVKTIRPEHATNSGMRSMLLEEARLTARLRHSNVVEVLDLGEEGATVFQVMTLVDGDSLSGLMQRWRARGRSDGLPPGITLRILADACRGLHAAHELRDDDGTPLRLVHRDVSPQNILIGADGVTKVADFGIAKALGRLVEETEAGQTKGKLAYMSPEQAVGKSLDRRSDVFAAGIVLWEALTGARLFRGEAQAETLDRVLNMALPDPSKSARIHPAIGAVALKALDREPSRRFSTADEMADACEEAAHRSGDMARARDVASFVVKLAGEDLAERRESVRTGSALILSRRRGNGRRELRKRYAVGLLGAGVVTTLGLVAIGMPRVQRPAETVLLPRGQSARMDPTPSATPPAIAAITTEGPPASAAPAVSSESQVESRREKTNVQGRRPKASPPTAKPRPPFGNPYDR